MSDHIKTQEVGSLAKPNWRVEPVKRGLINDQHFTEISKWGDKLQIDYEPLVDLLTDAKQHLADQGSLEAGTIEQIKWWAAKYAVRLQEDAGLNIVYDGEQDRPEMYQVAIEGSEGFEQRGRVRSLDDKSYVKAAVVSEPYSDGNWHVEEYKRLTGLTDRDIKLPITGAYTIADWSFNEFYEQAVDKGGRGLSKKEAKRQFVIDVAERVVRPNIEKLVEAGAPWIQIDEPAASTKPEEIPLFVESFNRSVAGILGKFSVHICYASDYSRFFPHINNLENCSQYALEFANRDSLELGTDPEHRHAYEVLKKFRKNVPEAAIGLGVVSVHETYIEPPELIRDRILSAYKILEDPDKIYPSPDCGLRVRNWDDAYQKLSNITAGTSLAEQVIYS